MVMNETRKGGLFLFILNRMWVWLLITTYNSVIFRRPGFNRVKVKGRLNIFLMTWNLNALNSRFSLPDKGRAVFSKGENCRNKGGKNGGLSCVWGLYK